MVALPDWAQRVGTLRKELGLKQVQFAAKFGVTQAAISRWESGAKEPSAENYIRMGNMAAKPGCFWFLEKAGVDVTRLRRLFLEEKQEPKTPNCILHWRHSCPKYISSLLTFEGKLSPVNTLIFAVLPTVASSGWSPLGRGSVARADAPVSRQTAAG